MEEKNLKKSKNKILGCVLIAYPFASYIILAIISTAIVAIFNIKIEEYSIVGPMVILKLLGVSSYLINMLKLIGLINGIAVPILIIVSGILLLKNKKSGIKIAIISFATDFISRFLFIIIYLSNIHVKKALFSHSYELVLFCIFFLIDFIFIYYLIKQKNKFFKDKVV